MTGTFRRMVIALIGLAVAPGLGFPSAESPSVLRYAAGKLVTGEWAYDLNVSGGGHLQGVQGRITGHGFGPGRMELAYCTVSESGSGSALWVAAVPVEEVQRPGVKALTGRPRLLWTAPAGTTLRGPIWWSPNGAQIAVRAVTVETTDLMTVDYVTGEAVALVRGAEVVDLAWDVRGGRAAYVTEGATGREVWLQTLPPGEARRLGRGGYDLRWALDGTLQWYVATSATSWTEARWEGAEVRESGVAPARAEGTMWSPDGRLCAALEAAEAGGKKLVIYAANSTKGEVIALPEVRLTRLLGWTPASDLMMVLADIDLPLLVAVAPPSGELARLLTEDSPVLPSGSSSRPEYSSERGHLFALPLDPKAGPPAWCFDSTFVAYVTAPKFDPATPWLARGDRGGAEQMQGRLLVAPVFRSFVGRAGPEEQAAKITVLSNLKNLSMALLAYARDHEGHHPSGNQAEIMTALGPYGCGDGIYLRPGSTEEVIVQFTLDSALDMLALPHPERWAVARVECYRSFAVVAYADGSARVILRSK